MDNTTKCSIVDYLERERKALDKHEYRDGEMRMMPVASINHSIIDANIICEIGNRLKGTHWRVHGSLLRLRVPNTPFYTYPDVSIVPDQYALDPDDSTGETITNPRVIIEVVSPETEAYDRGNKLFRYHKLESLEEYVLVSQRMPMVDSFLRQSGGTWLLRPSAGLDAVAKIQCLGIDLPLREVYAGIEFSPEQTPAAE